MKVRVHNAILHNRECLAWVSIVLDHPKSPIITRATRRFHAGFFPADVELYVRAATLSWLSERWSNLEIEWTEVIPGDMHQKANDEVQRAMRAAKKIRPRTANNGKGHTGGRGRKQLHRVIDKWGSLCHWCGVQTRVERDTSIPPEGRDATIEHLVPRSKGGSNGLKNLRCACYACNVARGAPDHDPEGGG